MARAGGAPGAGVPAGVGGAVGDEPGKQNRLMHPISLSGPYYACLLAGATLDTKGGAAARAYWAGCSTLGPMIGFAHRAAKTVHAEPARSL